MLGYKFQQIFPAENNWTDIFFFILTYSAQRALMILLLMDMELKYISYLNFDAGVTRL